MTEKQSSSSRLVNNTLMLYLRTLFIMCLGLFTSRVILQSLGIDNYGIYNVVGGFVGMFSVITQSLVSTTQRYLTVEIGKGDSGDPKHMFGVVLTIHLGLAALMLVVFETFGIYFLNYHLNIPDDRIYAANWVFQISVLTSCLGLLSTPYIGMIVSYERMRAFAYISIQDAILRLAICYALYVSPIDRLILYAGLLGLISIWNQFLYMRYCFKNFDHVKTKAIVDKGRIKSVFGFAGMNFLGSFAYILSTEGVTVILNMFFGVALNAARAIATQVQNITGRFTGDFMTALNPQITKEYASGNKQHSMMLGMRGAKFSFFIVLIIAIPICLRAPQLLTLWLDNFPEYTVEFVRLTMVMALIGVLSHPLVTLILAVGKITSTSLWIGGIKLCALPIIYVCFKYFDSPLYAYYVVIALDLLLIFIRLLILGEKTELPFLRTMTFKVLTPCFMISLLTVFLSYFINKGFEQSFDGLILFSVLSAVSSGIVIYIIGMTSEERVFVNGILAKLKNKVKRH